VKLVNERLAEKIRKRAARMVRARDADAAELRIILNVIRAEEQEIRAVLLDD
jgi:hypothetical protein